MKLHEYLLKNKIKQIDFASKLGISRMHLNRIINETRSPSKKLATKITKLTKGKVSFVSLMSNEARGNSKELIKKENEETKDRAGNKKTEQFSLL